MFVYDLMTAPHLLLYDTEEKEGDKGGEQKTRAGNVK